jgi:4-hydroxy-tetrahydrodipicolinate synthase
LTEPFRLAGVFSVLPTVFHDDGGLDLAGTAAVVRATRDAGVAGLTALGVMGEAAELSENERRAVLACARETVPDLAVVVGVSGDTARLIVERAGDAARTGVAALMVGPARSVGLAEAVEAAATAGLPIVIQDYPLGSGVTVTVSEIAAVAAAQPLVAGVKAEAPPTSGAIATLLAARPRLDVVGGLGGLFLIDELRAGASGVMTGFALPERLVSIVRTFAADPAAAEREWLRLLPLMRLEAFSPFSLVARKEVWRLRGVIGSSRCRRAGARLDDRARDDVRRALALVSPNRSPASS